MLSVFDVFKIILGIIISVFIIFVVMRFVGSYMEISESGRQVSLMVNFKKTVENVYTTGISTDFELKESEILGYRPPLIETESTVIDTSPTPTMLLPGKKLSVGRIDYDIGWWKFYVIEALPDTKIIFVVPDASEATWALVGNITKALPSTENTETKVRFGVGCTNKTVPNFGWEGSKFTDSIIPGVISLKKEFELCENEGYWNEKGYKLVTITQTPGEEDFVVKPGENGIGHVYIKTDDGYSDYIYRNSIDIAALLLGGQIFYRYMSGKFLSELDVAASVAQKEYGLLMTNTEMARRCSNDINDFLTTLSMIRETIPKVKDGQNEELIAEFAGYLLESRAKFRQLESEGCA